MDPISLYVKPNSGLNELRFGAGMEEAEKMFGKPEQTEQLDTEGEYPTTVWHFWSNGFSLFFDHAAQQKFTCAEIDNKNALLWDSHIFEMTEEEIVTLFRTKGFFTIDHETHEWGEKRVSFDDAMIDFYFEKGKLTSINFSIPTTKSEDKVLILPN